MENESTALFKFEVLLFLLNKIKHFGRFNYLGVYASTKMIYY